MKGQPEAVEKRIAEPGVTTLTGPRRVYGGLMTTQNGEVYRVSYEPYGFGNGRGVRVAPVLFFNEHARHARNAWMDRASMEKDENSGFTILSK